MSEAELQGEYGEQLVNRYFESIGFTVTSNPDKYGTWDSIIEKDGKRNSIQIKACTRFITKNSFRFHIGETGKTFDTIMECNHLICVIRNPPTMIDYKYAGSIVKILNHRDYSVARDGTLWIPSNPSTTKVLSKITPQELAILDSFKTSVNSW